MDLYIKDPSEMSYLWIEGNGNLDNVEAYFKDRQAAPDRFFSFVQGINTRSILLPFREYLWSCRQCWMNNDTANQYVHERNSLFPNLADSEKTVHDIATGWSEVRLNRDSHGTFRLIYFISKVIEEMDKQFSQVIVIRNMQYVDRISIFCLYHLINHTSLKQTLFVMEERDDLFEPFNSYFGDGIGFQSLLKRFHKKLSTPVIRMEQTKLNLKPSPICVEPLKDSLQRLSSDNNQTSLLESMYDSLVLLNLENVLYLADQIIKETDQPPVDMWRYVGIAQTFMGDLSRASQSFKKMYETSQKTYQKLKAMHLLALLIGKRQHNWSMAKKYIKEALFMADHCEDRNSFEVIYEKSWLYNFKAYILHAIDNDFKQSYQCIHEAERLIEPFKEAQDGSLMDEINYPILSKRLATNLKVNTAYLLERQSRYHEAMKIWSEIQEDILPTLPEIYHKEIYYYRGRLEVFLDQIPSALRSLQRSLEICLDYRDIHNEEIVRRELGYVYYLSNDFSSSFEEYYRSYKIGKQLGKRCSGELLFSIIHVSLQWGNKEQALAWLEQWEGELPKGAKSLLKNYSSLCSEKLDVFMERSNFALYEHFPIPEI